MPKDSPASWVSVRAVTWVLDEAPDVPPQVVAVLIGLARHAGDDGSDSYPSEATLARYARKSVRSVQRDLAQLLELGLIRIPADQSAAEHIRADRRPTVYDLAYAPERPDVDDTTSTSGRRTTRRTRHVVDDRTTRRTRPNDPTHTSPEEDIEEDRKIRVPARDATGPAAQATPCPHGTPGGALPHPKTRKPRCPLCRAHVTSCDRDPLYCPTCQDIRTAAGLPPDPRADGRVVS